MDKWDVVVIGGGIVGLSTAMALLAEKPGMRVAVLEAESDVATHQSGRNSGVIHAGLYYAPGSFKAKLCAAGREAMYRFCEERGIAHRRCGKVVVATEERELDALATLEKRATANNLSGVKRLDTEGVRKHEPHVKAIAGLWIPQTGVVDFAKVAMAHRDVVRERRGTILTNARVVGGKEQDDGVALETTRGRMAAKKVVNCAGLHCDRVARTLGLHTSVRITPFRGDYFVVSGASAGLVRSLIYPVPDARYPFLGVHLTRSVDDRVEAGPNAALALARHGYTPWRVSLRDVAEMAVFPGVRRFLRANWRTGVAEVRRSLSRRAFARAARRLVPAIEAQDLSRGRSGVRAQAIDVKGNLVKDFHIERTARCTHVLNAPSPAATASIVIGQHIANLVMTDCGRKHTTRANEGKY